MITRRDSTRLLLAGAASLALAPAARAATAEEWRKAFEDALNAAMVRENGTRLSLVHFGFGRKSGWAGFSAVVRMDWPPGMRMRRFDATAEGERETFRFLVGKMLDEFRAVNPMGVRQVAFR